MLRIIGAVVAVVLGFVGLTGPASAQDFPSKPIQLVVPFPPGGGTDLIARLAAESLSQKLGQNVAVVNKPGAGTAIGMDFVAKSKPDGYTLIWATSDGMSILPALKASLAYRLPEDFSFVAATAAVTVLAAVPAKAPFRTIQDLVAYGKANPGKLRYSSAGVGSGAHLATALFARAARLDMVHVPYQGSNPSVAALVGGFVDLALAGSASIKPFSDAGTLRALGTADKKRHRQFPDVPTLEEAGLPDTDVQLYMGVLGPPGLPDSVSARLSKELAEVLKDPAIVARIRDLGIEPSYLDGPGFKDFIVKDLARWKDVAKGANIALTD